MLRLCRIEHIDAAHYLPQHPKCGQVHGHTYRIEVIIANEDDRDMLMDLDELKERIWQVLKRYDHKLLNDVMDCVPTVENIARTLHRQLIQTLPNYHVTVRVWEGENKWAEYGQ